MSRTPDQLVAAEVHYCVNYLVSTLACNYGLASNSREMNELTEQAMELASPIDDWEEAAIQAGWHCVDHNPSLAGLVDFPWRHADAHSREFQRTAQDACELDGIDPYQREVFEHWIVSDWLAGKLAEKGEKVDTDFVGLTVWARTTSGQGIASDSVIEAICAELNAAA